MSNTRYIPGDIVKLGDIEFVVLDDMTPENEDEQVLFILALKSQRVAQFRRDTNAYSPGNVNDYTTSNLKDAVNEWYCKLLERLNCEEKHQVFIRSREVDLTTLDGYQKYGSLHLYAAPLTLDEARKYAKIIPNPDKACWLATGWGGPEHFGCSCALYIDTAGSWNYDYCYNSHGIRPAMVVSSCIFDKEKPDLGAFTSRELMEELIRRNELNI